MSTCNEVFDIIKTSGFSFKNPDGSIPSIGSILQTNSVLGTASFTANIACNDIITGIADISSAIFSGSFGNSATVMTVGPITSASDVQVSDTSGDLIVDYIASDNGSYILTRNYITPDEISNLFLDFPSTGVGNNSSMVGNSSNYLVMNNGALLWQQTSGKNDLSTRIYTTDAYSNVTQWKTILAQSGAIALLNPGTASLSAIATVVNTLILLFASRGALMTIGSGPVKPVIDSSGLRVDVSGFTISWAPISSCTYSVMMDDRVYAQGLGVTQYSFTGFSNTNNFPYIVKVIAVDSLGRYRFSDPFPVVIRNINSNPNDPANYYGSFGQGPTSQAYYRAKNLNAINYITVSVEPTILPTNQTQNKLVLLGSNASTSTPIQLRYWNESSSLNSSLKITDTRGYYILYNTTTELWSIWN